MSESPSELDTAIRRIVDTALADKLAAADELLTAAEAAAFLKCSYRWFIRHAPPGHGSGKLRRWRPSELVTWLDRARPVAGLTHQ
jgi:hypothetical protein